MDMWVKKTAEAKTAKEEQRQREHQTAKETKVKFEEDDAMEIDGLEAVPAEEWAAFVSSRQKKGFLRLKGAECAGFCIGQGRRPLVAQGSQREATP